MSDLISRQAAIDRINKQREHLKPGIDERDAVGDAAYRVCAEFIERLPSAQPERKKGKWIESGTIACSVCHIIWLYRRTNYCPNCGADMRGET